MSYYLGDSVKLQTINHDNRMNDLKALLSHSSQIEAKIGHSFQDKSLLSLAFVHRSYINENQDASEHNERLEYLGDSILGFLIAEYLYRYLPNTPEGELSYLRSRLVEASSCVVYVQKLDLEKYLLLGKGEQMNDGRGRESILADLFESLIGAIYLDGGMEASRRFLFKNFSKEIEEILKTPVCNWKAQLQDYCQKKYRHPPIYKVTSESGPDHLKTFTISVVINNEEVGHGQGPSKKEAQQAAAKDAFTKIEQQSDQVNTHG
jgi:ribonuclease III